MALRLSHLTGLCFSGSDSQGDSPPSGLTWTSNGTLFHRFGSVFTGPQSIAKTLFLFWGALVRYHGEGNGTHPTPAVLPGKSHGRRSLAGSTGSQRVGQHWATEHARMLYKEGESGKGRGRQIKQQRKKDRGREGEPAEKRLRVPRQVVRLGWLVVASEEFSTSFKMLIILPAVQKPAVLHY